MMAVSALSTKDNPFNPFTEFDKWYSYDESHGYHSCSYLARMAVVSESLSDSENEEEIESAIDEIVSTDPFHNFIKVTKNDTNS